MTLTCISCNERYVDRQLFLIHITAISQCLVKTKIGAHIISACTPDDNISVVTTVIFL